MFSTIWERFRAKPSSSSSSGSQSVSPAPRGSELPHDQNHSTQSSKRRQKTKLSRQTGIMLWFPLTVGLVPIIPTTAEAEVGFKWMDKYLKPKQLKEGKEGVERHSLINPTSSDSIQENLSEAKAALYEFQNSQWKIPNGKDEQGKTSMVPIAKLIGRVCNQINEYTYIGDTMVQHNPFMTAIVWGTFKVLLKAGASDYEMTTKLAELIDKYTAVSLLYHKYWTLYQYSLAASGKQVLEVLKVFEEDIAKFTHAARRYFYTKHAVLRIGKAVLTPFSIEFQPLCDAINETTERLERYVNEAMRDEELRFEISQWLSTIPHRASHDNACQKRVVNTCGWLIGKREFQKWKASLVSSTLWVNGKAGSGKTILMSSVVEHLLSEIAATESQSRYFGYIYCRHDQPETLEPAKIIGTILKQLISRLPRVPEKLLELFQAQKRQGEMSSPHTPVHMKVGLMSVWEEIRKSQENSVVFILIDGFDECTEEARAVILDMLTPDVGDSPLCEIYTKIAIFSRYQEDVKMRLRLGPVGSFEEVSIQQADTIADMRVFVSTKVQGNPLLMDHEDMKARITENLVKRANGMFLWVTVQQNTICKERDIGSIEYYLKNLPNSSDMNESYWRMLDKISKEETGNKRLAVHALGWVLHTTRPMSVAELTDVLRFSKVTTKIEDSEVVKDVIAVCHSMLEVERKGEGDFFKIIHLSAREFLMDIFGTTPAQPLCDSTNTFHSLTDLGFNLDPVALQTRIARICVQYLAQSHFKFGPWSVEELFKCRVEFDTFMTSYPFLKYAAVSWTIHLAQADSANNPELLESVEDLFKLHFNIGLAFQVYWFQTRVDPFPLDSTPFHVGCYFGVVDYLKPSRNDMRFSTKDQKGHTPLYWAALNGHKHVLQLLGFIETYADETQKTNSPITSTGGWHASKSCRELLIAETLHAAVEGNQVELVEALLIAHAKPELEMLLAASAKGNLKIVQLLYQAPELESSKAHVDALIAAVTAGAVDVVQYLLVEGVDVNARSKDGNCALHAAVVTGNEAMVRLLLAKDADISRPSDGSEGVFELAGTFCDHEVIEILLEEAQRRGLHNELVGPDATSTVDVGQNVQHTHDRGERSGPRDPPRSIINGKALRVAARAGILQVVQGAISGNLEIFRKLNHRVVAIFRNRFDGEDVNYAESTFDLLPELLDELLRSMEITSEIILTAFELVPPILTHIALYSNTELKRYIGECTRATMGMIFTKIVDDGYGGMARSLALKYEEQVLDLIESGKQEEAEEFMLFAGQMLDAGVLTIGRASSLVLRGTIKVYNSSLSKMLTTKPPRARHILNSFLADVSMTALDPQIHGLEKRKLIIVIEMAYGASANGQAGVLGLIRPTLIQLLTRAKGKHESEIDQLMIAHLKKAVYEKTIRWKWDEEATTWWDSYEYFNLYAGKYGYSR